MNDVPKQRIVLTQTAASTVVSVWSTVHEGNLATTLAKSHTSQPIEFGAQMATMAPPSASAATAWTPCPAGTYSLDGTGSGTHAGAGQGRCRDCPDCRYCRYCRDCRSLLLLVLLPGWGSILASRPKAVMLQPSGATSAARDE